MLTQILGSQALPFSIQRGFSNCAYGYILNGSLTEHAVWLDMASNGQIMSVFENLTLLKNLLPFTSIKIIH